MLSGVLSMQHNIITEHINKHRILLIYSIICIIKASIIVNVKVDLDLVPNGNTLAAKFKIVVWDYFLIHYYTSFSNAKLFVNLRTWVKYHRK